MFVQSAKSHTDRIMELNFKMFLRDLPVGKDLYVAGTGGSSNEAHLRQQQLQLASRVREQGDAEELLLIPEEMTLAVCLLCTGI